MKSTCICCAEVFERTGRERTCSKQCRLILRKKSKQKWYAKNTDLVAKKTAEWRTNNPERFKKLRKKYYAKNRSEIIKKQMGRVAAYTLQDRLVERERNRISCRKWKAKNKTRVKSYGKEYAKKNRDKIAAYQHKKQRQIAILQQQLDLLSIKGFLEQCLPPSQIEPPQK